VENKIGTPTLQTNDMRPLLIMCIWFWICST